MNKVFVLMSVALLGLNLQAVEYQINGGQVHLMDNLHSDLQPGFKVSCRVKFDKLTTGTCGEYILRKSIHNRDPGAFILRYDGDLEGRKFSFFVNTGDRIEPRVSSERMNVELGRWYDLAAGWDGKELWLTVDGKTTRNKRTGPAVPIRDRGHVVMDGMFGTVADPEIVGASSSVPYDTVMYPGFKIYGEAIFRKLPTRDCDTMVVNKRHEYMLRYDLHHGESKLNLFVFVGGGWEKRASVPVKAEVGRRYRFAGGWTGKKLYLEVEGIGRDEVDRTGAIAPLGEPLRLGTAGMVKVENFAVRSEAKAFIDFGMFSNSGLLPRMGEDLEVTGKLINYGADLKSAATMTLKATDGVKMITDRIELGRIASGEERNFKFKLNPGNVGEVAVTCSVSAVGMDTFETRYEAYILPRKDPDFSAKAWNPPIKPTKTYYIDSIGGDDSNDGLSSNRAWRTVGKARGLVLGPGEQLLLRRNSLFDDYLEVTGRGEPGNWAEIGAYGEGMRPTIRRNRMLDQRCALVVNPHHLVIRDLIVCNAGDGLGVYCQRPDSGNVLIERILAHHIEGKYRHNSHGIPEWQDIVGAEPKQYGISSCGVHFSGRKTKNTVMRDCEAYQCSHGFRAGGVNSFTTRMFCHDNFAHNTSPHPYDYAKRAWMIDCIFDASGWHASAGTMGIMLSNNRGYVIRGCHFLNQPDSGSHDQGGVDFENEGENCLIEECTFRNNAGCPIEILGLRKPQTRNVWIRRNRFYMNNWAHKNGPSVIQVWGSANSPKEVCCSNGLIEDNGYVTLPDVPFYINNTRSTNDWKLVNNRGFDFEKDLTAAYPFADPPEVKVPGEIWTDRPDRVALDGRASENAQVEWEQTEGPVGVRFRNANERGTLANFPAIGDYRVMLKADDGRYWRTARTAVHVLPKGSTTHRVWTFAKNLDTEGWTVENPGTVFKFLQSKRSFWSTTSHPVKYVCGDYFVIAVENSGKAAIVTPDTMNVGVAFGKQQANVMRIKLQNRTNSKSMRLYYTYGNAPAWSEKDSVTFEVKTQDPEDSVYTVQLPDSGQIRQLKLAFSADGEPITGTVRIDYIWLGHIPEVDAGRDFVIQFASL